MSKIARSLGIPENNDRYRRGDDGSDKEVISQETSVEVEEVQVGPADVTYEEERIRDGDLQLDAIIKDGKAAYMEMFSRANDMDPRYQARWKEVAGTYLKTTLDAIQHKQKIAKEMRSDKVKEAQMSAPVSSNTTVNNIYADRETILSMLEDGEVNTTPEGEE